MVSTPATPGSSRRVKVSHSPPGLTLPYLLPFPLGHPLAEQLLSAALVQGKLASAYLFTGPTGIGKARAAHWLAAQILYGARRSNSRLSGTALANQVEAGSHPDLVILEPESTGKGQIRIEAVQALRQQIQETSMGWRWVVILDRADRLSAEVGNALLKILEDRTACTFILTAQHQVLSTIRSRCQQIRFGPLSAADLQAVVQQHCPELLGCGHLLQASSGSPGLAISLWNHLTRMPLQIREQIQTFNPKDPAQGTIQALHLAQGLSGLEPEVQRALLHLWMMCDLTETQHGLINQAQQLLDTQVNAQGVWELLLVGLALEGAGWTIELPVQEQPPGVCVEGQAGEQAGGQVGSRVAELALQGVQPRREKGQLQESQSADPGRALIQETEQVSVQVGMPVSEQMQLF